MDEVGERICINASEQLTILRALRMKRRRVMKLRSIAFRTGRRASAMAQYDAWVVELGGLIERFSALNGGIGEKGPIEEDE